MQGDHIPLANPHMRPDPPDLQHLWPGAGEQAGDRQYGERRDAARPSGLPAHAGTLSPFSLKNLAAPW